jgi:hypothetical protein
MSRHKFACLGAAAVALLTVCPGGAGVPRAAPGAQPAAAARQARAVRDWKRFPAVVELDTTQDVYAVGDVHGDYDRLVTLLAAGKLIAPDPARPDRVRWRAGKAVLVCTGDLIDKGRRSLDVLALFQALQEDAARAGGRVLVLMGNHEAEFLADPEDDEKALEFIKELEKRGVDPADLAAGRDPLGAGAFLRSLPFAARVNDWFFIHAGNTRGKSLERLRAALQAKVDAGGFGAKVLVGKKGVLEARLHPAPWWEKKGEDPKKSEARLRRSVEALGVKHLVIGHQPGKVKFADGGHRKKGEICQKFDGLVFLIDVGMSEAIDYSRGALLHIRGGDRPRAAALFPEGGPEQLWPKP